MAQSDVTNTVAGVSNFQKERTLGDGMDSSLLKLTEDTLKRQIQLSSNPVATFKPVIPQSKTFALVPKYIPKERKQPKCLIGKPKEPKFIPYEPYKGAIEPIMPKKWPKVSKVKPSKNNVEIQELVTQMSEMRAAELQKDSKEAIKNDELISKRQWEKERTAFETDIKNLRETNSHLENQLKFQAQVNSELKTLLVAAVGEDLESRVQHLTEDKLQLAKALLNSANHLTSHQEQTEWLSGQCEVWRSKFLASSLMVEELARWKSALSARINELQEAIKGILDDNQKVQKQSQKTFCFLNSALQKMAESEDEVCPSEPTLKHSNIIELCDSNCKLAKKIGTIANVEHGDINLMVSMYMKMPHDTTWEANAQKLLQNPVTISTKQDAICNALMDTALSLSGEQKYLQHPGGHSTCCSHCKGEMEHI